MIEKIVQDLIRERDEAREACDEWHQRWIDVCVELSIVNEDNRTLKVEIDSIRDRLRQLEKAQQSEEAAMNEELLTRYLHLLKQQWFANQLGFGDDWTEGMNEMDLLWRELTDEERDESERRFSGMKRELEDWRPDAPMDLGLVDRAASSGVSPRRPQAATSG